jgi:hypothetical protein
MKFVSLFSLAALTGAMAAPAVDSTLEKRAVTFDFWTFEDINYSGGSVKNYGLGSGDCGKPFFSVIKFCDL